MNTIVSGVSAPLALRPPHRYVLSVTDYISAAIVCTVVTTGFLAIAPGVWHWFIIPVWASGCLILVDIVHWWRSRDHLARARYFCSLLGTFTMFLAPMLHVALDNWMTFVVPPPDWRPWLGRMAALNVLGLVGYRAVLHLGRSSRRASKTRWELRPELLVPSIYAGLAVSAVAQAYFYVRFGGIVSFASTVPSSDKSQFLGSAWQFAIAESFPYLLLLLIGIRYRREAVKGRWWSLCALLGAFACISVIFGGLRGSRANVVWPMLAVLSMIDLIVRRIPRFLLPVLIGLLVVFSFVYGFFKSEGLTGLIGATDSQHRTQLERTYNRSLEDIVLSDLGRADVQSFLLYRLYGSGAPYAFARGETYFGALALPVPPTLWATRPDTKLAFGTEAQYGPGRTGPGNRPSSRVYGLQGEALLNFGYLLVPVSLWCLGMVVMRVDAVIGGWISRDDGRVLLAPLLLIGVLQLLIQDADILVFFLAKTAAIPILLLFLTSGRRTHRMQPESVPG